MWSSQDSGRVTRNSHETHRRNESSITRYYYYLIATLLHFTLSHRSSYIISPLAIDRSIGQSWHFRKHFRCPFRRVLGKCKCVSTHDVYEFTRQTFCPHCNVTFVSVCDIIRGRDALVTWFSDYINRKKKMVCLSARERVCACNDINSCIGGSSDDDNDECQTTQNDANLVINILISCHY